MNYDFEGKLEELIETYNSTVDEFYRAFYFGQIMLLCDILNTNEPLDRINQWVK